MKRGVTAAAMVVAIAGSALAADVTYTEPPEDTAMIRVEGGTTTVAGLAAYSHLTHRWTFDDPDNPYADSVGDLPLQAVVENDPQWKTGAEAKRGGAMWCSSGFKVSENFIDGRSPFTICFWVKQGSEVPSQGTYVYIGQTPKSKGTEITDTPFMRMTTGNTGNPGRIQLWENQIAHKSTKSTTLVPAGTWTHVALTCEVLEEPDCVASNRYSVWVGGTLISDLTMEVPTGGFAVTDNFRIGHGWHYNGTEIDIGDATFDEVMCFDRALSSDELRTYAAYSAPVDFPAGWDIAADGTLRIAGISPLTALRGHGLCETVDALRLAASSNDWFAGVISAPGFTFAGGEGVVQGLQGANSYAGPTTVESGTLEVSSTPMQLFGDALVAWYPFDDASNPGRDFSPRGNDLSPNAGFAYEALPAEGTLAGTGLMMSMTNCLTGATGISSDSVLKGFVSGEDNSYTVAFWMRDDTWHYREGPFSFASASTFRCSGTKTTTLIGDGSLFAIKNQTVWGEGVWHHWTIVYDATASKDTCYFLFKDGRFVGSGAGDATINHASDPFHLGRSANISANSVFEGALDEVIVLNSGDTNNVAKLYGFRCGCPVSAGGTLPAGTDLTVAEGAVLKLNAANETVARLYGKGTIDLSGNSKLTVTTKDRFEGMVIGGEITDGPGAGRQGLMILFR